MSLALRWSFWFTIRYDTMLLLFHPLLLGTDIVLPFLAVIVFVFCLPSFKNHSQLCPCHVPRHRVQENAPHVDSSLFLFLFGGDLESWCTTPCQVPLPHDTMKLTAKQKSSYIFTQSEKKNTEGGEGREQSDQSNGDDVINLYSYPS